VGPVRHPRKILLIRPSALGDVCRTVPLVVSLRRAFPDSVIDWVVQDTFVDAVTHHPAVRRVIPFPRTSLGRSMRRGNPAPTLAFLRSLRAGRYDLTIDAQGLGRSGLFTWATRAIKRIGHAHAPEGAWLGYTHRVSQPGVRHTVDRMLGLLAPLRIPAVRDMRLHADPQAVSDVVVEHAEPFVLLAPTSRWASKRWPEDRFAELARRLLERGVPRVVIVGSPSERDQCRSLLELASDDPRVTDRVGSTTIAQLMALVARAKLVVANDSAALHMAVGFDRPTVALYGPTDVARVGPYRREEDVIQHVSPGDPIDHKTDGNVALMERITVDQVFAASVDRLERSPAYPRAAQSA